MSLHRNWIICSLLFAATLAVYGQAIRFEFVLFDDDWYVTGNPHIQKGLTAQAIRWAFATGYFFNWHPLTWISHMLDVELYGLDPAGHHATSVLLHALNSLLLFGVLRSMTRAPWPSAFAAALIACTARAWSQARYWRDSVSLFEHALAVMPTNTTVHNNLGNALRARGRTDQAIRHYREALRLAPHSGRARHNLVNTLAMKGEIDEAIVQLRQRLDEVVRRREASREGP